MKSMILTTLALSVICCGSSIGSAAESSAAEKLPSARSDGPIVIHRKVYRNESLAELGSRLYDKVDYELKLRLLTRDIRVADAELDLQRERMRVYDKYFGYTDALLVTRQETKLDVVRLEEQLKLLRQAKLLALRHRNDQVRYRELLLAEGAARLQLAD
jgi:hypothetical protein